MQCCDQDFHLSVHRRQVPNAADNGPAAHHPQKIIHHAKLTAVPESIPKPGIILQDGKKTVISSVGKSRKEEKDRKGLYLNGNWIDGAVNFKAALFEHHH